MFEIIKDNNGVAFIMVLLLLVLVGSLTAALMNAGVFNVRFGINETERVQAFYAAESGVEYIRSKTNTKSFDEVKSFFNSEVTRETDKFEFKIEIDEDSKNSSNNINFTSRGIFNGHSESISINFVREGRDEPFQIEHYGDDPDKYLKGHSSRLEDDEVLYIGPDITPSRSYWYDEFKNEIDNIEYKEFGYDNDDYENVLNENYLYDEDNAFVGYVKTGWQNQNKKNELELNDLHIKNSILIIDGDVKVNQNTTFENSIIVINGNLHFAGAPNQNVEKSLFYIYRTLDQDADSELNVAGTYTNENKGEWELEQKPELDFFDIGNLASRSFFRSWRQVR